MKNTIAFLAAVYFLVLVSGPLFAAATTPAPTPSAKTANSNKHKKAHKHKKGRKALGAPATPAAK